MHQVCAFSAFPCTGDPSIGAFQHPVNCSCCAAVHVCEAARSLKRLATQYPVAIASQRGWLSRPARGLFTETLRTSAVAELALPSPLRTRLAGWAGQGKFCGTLRPIMVRCSSQTDRSVGSLVPNLPAASVGVEVVM